jgi:hypothetical protein
MIHPRGKEPAMAQAAQTQVDSNYEAFEAVLPDILEAHAGQFALISSGEIVEYFENSLAATLAGARRFGVGRYSVQEVTDQPENLGFYSYVGGTGDY